MTSSLRCLRRLAPAEMSDASRIKRQLRDELKFALKSRQSDAVSAFRTAIAAIDNAEAVQPGEPTTQPPNLSPLGSAFGSTELLRRTLSQDEVSTILQGEMDQRTEQAFNYEALGRPEDAERLRREAAILEPFLNG